MSFFVHVNKEEKLKFNQVFKLNKTVGVYDLLGYLFKQGIPLEEQEEFLEKEMAT